MSIDVSGRDTKVKPTLVRIQVSANHPLIKLALSLPWALLMTIVVEDLKKSTAKGFWWLGRKIRVRIHLVFDEENTYRETPQCVQRIALSCQTRATFNLAISHF